MSWWCCHFYEITWPKTWILWVLRTERCGASSFPITGTNSFGRAILINLNIGQTKTLKKRVLSYLEYTVDSVLDQSQPLVAISKGKAQEILGNVHSSAEGSCTLEMTPGRLDCGAVWATNATPLKLQNKQSESWTKKAFEISYHTQLLYQVSAKLVDDHFWPLEHLLRQEHLNPITIQTFLQSDLNLASNWFQANGVTSNPSRHLSWGLELTLMISLFHLMALSSISLIQFNSLVSASIKILISFMLRRLWEKLGLSCEFWSVINTSSLLMPRRGCI